MNKKPRPLFAVGDAHGQYHEFAAVLIDSGLMSIELEWTGKNAILLQTGDVLDRGPMPLEIDKLLDILQPQAKASGGEIIRLIGNHELEILRKNYFITSLPYAFIEPYRCKLIKDVLEGKVCAAYGARGFLFTHAGVCDNLYAVLKKEITKKPAPSVMARHINDIFKDAVATAHYRHPIFNVSYLRGGGERFGGIFWEDINSLFENHQLCPFKQIVGHTPMHDIAVSEDKKIIAVDVGMEEVFNGNFKYLKIIKNGKFQIKRTGA